ncbi:MAG: hypothetical protein CSB15_00055 [Clostridiales bacterium]|nr:MAG: hypothetical protein CSB15_00055 [Clostridiales bacterium]
MIKLKELINFLDAKYFGNFDFEPKGVCVDSRKIKEGDLFFALKGERENGEKYLEDAFKNGAVAAVVSNSCLFNKRDRLIYVDDVSKALKIAARKYMNKVNPITVGVTGSVGKTTVKEFMYEIFSYKNNAMKTAGNLNSEVGISMSILEMDENVEYAVIEHGIDEIGEMIREVEISNLNHAIITLIGSSHLEIFGSRDVIFNEKTAIAINFKKDSNLVVNGTDDYLGKMKSNKFNIVKVGESNGLDYKIDSLKIENSKTYFTLKNEVNSYDFVLNLCGYHYAYDAAYAIVMAFKLGFSYKDIYMSLLNVKQNKSRFEIKKKGDIIIIDDAYNSSFESLMLSCKSAFEMKASRYIGVFGDILQIGKFPQESHKNIGKKISERYNFNKVYFYGNMMKYAYDEYCGEKEYFSSFNELINSLNKYIKDEDLVLIKASFSIGLYRLADSILED